MNACCASCLFSPLNLTIARWGSSGSSRPSHSSPPDRKNSSAEMIDICTRVKCAVKCNGVNGHHAKSRGSGRSALHRMHSSPRWVDMASPHGTAKSCKETQERTYVGFRRINLAQGPLNSLLFLVSTLSLRKTKLVGERATRPW